jgi:ATP/maltotriose-dependent transcriptional regulator MalT
MGTVKNRHGSLTLFLEAVLTEYCREALEMMSKGSGCPITKDEESKAIEHAISEALKRKLSSKQKTESFLQEGVRVGNIQHQRGVYRSILSSCQEQMLKAAESPRLTRQLLGDICQELVTAHMNGGLETIFS